MTDWFRSWHGAPTDQKWLAIAKRAQVAPVLVVAVVWTLMDRASQHADRGSVAGYDAEAMAVFLGIDESAVEAVIAALREKGVVTNFRLTAWESRQPKRERENDFSTPRVQLHRENHKIETPRNASADPETPRVEESRVDIESSLRSDSCPKRSRVRTRYPEDFEKFWSAYPTDRLMTKAATLPVWLRLDEESKEMAIRSSPAFSAYCKGNPDYRPVHATRFLRERRFETFGAPEAVDAENVAPPRFFVRRNTAPWAAWVNATSNNGGRGFPIIQHGGQEGWWFPTERPEPRGQVA